MAILNSLLTFVPHNEVIEYIGVDKKVAKVVFVGVGFHVLSTFVNGNDRSADDDRYFWLPVGRHC
jgi:hypothetical protein